MENSIEKPQQESKPAGYRVESVLLVESTFKRHPIDILSEDLQADFKVDSQPHETAPDNKFAVTLAIEYIGKQRNVELFTATVKMLGVFEKYGEPALSDEKFKAINAPAILYPFIREYLYSSCLRAGIANVLLPTVNFKP